MVFAQPDHDGDCGYERKALTETGGESEVVGEAEVASLIGHEHPAVPEPVEDTVVVDGAFVRGVIPRVSAADQPCPVRVPLRAYRLERREPSRRGFDIEFMLGKTLLPSVPVAFVHELGAAIAIELHDIGLGREDPGPVLCEGGGPVDDKGWGYLDWLDLSACQVEEFCGDSNEGMREGYCVSKVGNMRNNVFLSAV